MNNIIRIVVCLMALSGLMLMAVQCDGEPAPMPTASVSAYPGSAGTAEPESYPASTAEILAPPTPSPEAYPADTPGAGLKGEELLKDRCTQCHTLERVQGAKKTAEEWRITVTLMREKGAQLSNVEATILIGYLASTYK